MSYSAFLIESPGKHIPELDGLRGIAITLVVLWHSRPEPAAMFDPILFLHTLIGFGPYGVDLFFVLSGFLITGILLDARDSDSYFGAFYLRRALRILPVYVVAIAAFFWIQLPWLHSHGAALDLAMSDQSWYWSFSQNWHDVTGNISGPLTQFWSLAVEEQFYLVWPLLLFCCPRRFFLLVFSAVVATALAVRVCLVSGHFVSPELLGEWIHRSTITRMDTLAVGAIIAVVVRRPEWAQAIRGWVRVIAPLSVAVFTLCCFTGERFSDTIGYTAIAVACGCAVLVCAQDSGSSHLLCSFMRLRVLRSLGKYSYAMYVLHVAVIFSLHTFTERFIFPNVERFGLQRVPILAVSLIALAACLAASYLAALVSWNLLEKHFLRLKDRFAYRKTIADHVVTETIG